MKVKTSYLIHEQPPNGANGHTNGNGNGQLILPSWIIKLGQRLLKLPNGRYQVILTIDRECDWTVIELGKVEKSSRD